MKNFGGYKVKAEKGEDITSAETVEVILLETHTLVSAAASVLQNYLAFNSNSFWMSVGECEASVV